MPKFVRCEMIDGSKWDVPLETIAKDYVANHAPGDAYSDAELLEWADQVQWGDVHEAAVMVESPKPDPFYGWLTGPKSLVEKP